MKPTTTIDNEGYPTKEFLRWIEKYNCINNDPFQLIQIVLKNWHHGDSGWAIRRKYRGVRNVHVSTLGWSGNEAMIESLSKNFMFWTLSYYSHKIGGHYKFKFKEKI